MITTYLNLNGNASEAIAYYAKVFKAPEPYVMRFSDMPEEDQQFLHKEHRHLVAYANVKTFAGDLMLADEFPGKIASPTSAVYINLSGKDEGRLREVFDALAKDGEVEMPLDTTFFAKLFGSLKDKYGFHWMIMTDDEG